MYVIKTEEMKVPLKVFSTKNSIEEQCIAQMETVSSLPFLHHHVSLMPDGHLGIGASIGSVVATNNVILPSLVGVDIGCGMCAVRTSLTDISTETLKQIMGEIRQRVPTGFSHHEKAQSRDLMPIPCSGENDWSSKMPIVFREFTKAIQQLGTLGGGNHFIEIQKGDDGFIWIMIHSGSRNLGKQVADHYNKVAQDLCKKWYSNIPEFKGDDGLAFLPVDSSEGKMYLSEMQYCVDFALANRKLMMDRICDIFSEVICEDTSLYLNLEPMINIAHNYAKLENHYGKNVWVHRKGATSARLGEVGIIPGSQGTHSYITIGKGNPESFCSSSHGAGRKMGRGVAMRTLNLADEQKKMEGIVHGIRSDKQLDEAPGAYKEIGEVMENQKDLVSIKIELTPLAVIKGD